SGRGAERLAVGEVGGRRAAGLGENHFAVVFVINNFLKVPSTFFNADLGEKRAQLEILFVGPLLEGMIVAVSADKADSQKQLGRILHVGVRLVGNQVVIRGGIVISAAARGDQLVDELVIGLVFRHRFANPITEAPQAFL